MAKRSKYGQQLHDRKVRQRAELLKNQGYRVRADILGYPRPPKIGNRLPDIAAYKNRKLRRIEEIETPSTLKQDTKQRDI